MNLKQTMKKGFPLGAIFAAMIVFASFGVKAATTVAMLSTDSTYHSLTAHGTRLSGTGAYDVTLEGITSGGTWLTSQPVHVAAGQNSFQVTLDSLLAGTLYDIRIRARDASDSVGQVTPTRSVHTAPAPLPADVTFVRSVPSLPESFIIVSYHSVGSASKVFGLDFNAIPVTDTILVTGTGTDTLRVRNAPGQGVPAGFPVIVPVLSQVLPTQGTNTWPAFTAPSAIAVSVGALDTVYVSQDSMRIKGTVTLGNTATPTTLSRYLYDSIGGSLIYQWAPTILAIGGPVHSSVGGLTPNTLYKEVYIVTDSVGSDTSFLMVRTKKVPNPTITIGTVTKTSRSYTVPVSVATNGAWTASQITDIWFIEGGIDADSLNNLSVSNTGNFNFARPNKVPGTTYTYKVKVRTNTGQIFVTQQYSVTTNPPVTDNAPSFGNLVEVNSWTVEMQGITRSVASGSTATIKVVQVNNDAGTADTFTIASQVTGSGPLPSHQFTTLANTSYCWTILDISIDTIVTVGNSRCLQTQQAVNPIAENIEVVNVTKTTIDVNGKGNGGGDLSLTDIRAYDTRTNMLVGSPLTQQTGPGDITLPYSLTNVDSGVMYRFVITVSERNGNNGVNKTVYITTLPGEPPVDTTPTGIENPLAVQEEAESITVWTASGITHVTCSADFTDRTLEVYDLSGKTLSHSVIVGMSTDIATSQWAHGMYIVTIVSDRQRITKKIIL